MKGYLLVAALLPVLAVGQAQHTSIRYWFAYGDSSTSQLSRVSGIDSQAAVGREIPARLAVPAMGSFKVQMWCVVNSSSGIDRLLNTASVNLAFDRTYCGDANQNPPLNAQSFRKVRPSGTNPNDYLQAITDGGILPAWVSGNKRSDEDNDGIQDTAQLSYTQAFPSAWRQGTQGSGESLRPVGLATYMTPRLVTPTQFAGAFSSFKIPNGTPFRLFDVNWVSMLSVGSTYGNAHGETGLTITTSTQTGLANATSILSNSAHTGAKYTLVAVAPEPNGLLALAASMVLARRRRT